MEDVGVVLEKEQSNKQNSTTYTVGQGTLEGYQITKLYTSLLKSLTPF